jgi:hypothetical protein
MSMLQSIVEWAETDLLPWQSDTVRRLLTQDNLTETDKAEILAMVKKRQGIIDKEHSAPDPQPIRKGHISGVPQVDSGIILKQMVIKSNVNAIPDGSKISFGHKGLTVIYGENASGKSGYARVLKRACNARDTEESLLPNAFEPPRPGSAKARFKVGISDGIDKEISWTDGQQSDPVLSNICVFDSKCARVIVDENNEVSYLPYGARVFEDLVTLFQDLRSRLESEKPKPKKLEYADIPSSTQAGILIANLSHKTSYDQIEKAVKWSDINENRLKGIKKRISYAEAHDPRQQALRVRNVKNRIIKLLDIIIEADLCFSDSQAKDLIQAINDLTAAEKALEIVSQESLTNEPLPGAGSEVWQKLYYAAKSYSTQIAYPEHDFPFIGTDSFCVLCMQPLMEDAKKRMQRFKEFMEKTAKKQVEIAGKKIEDQKKSMEQVVIPTSDAYQDVLDEIGARSPQYRDEMIAYFSSVNNRAESMIKFAIDKKERPFPKINDVSLECPAQIAGDLEREAREIEKTADPKALAQLKTESSELSARKTLNKRLHEVKTYIEQLKIAQKYESCISETDYRRITLKGKRMITESLTPQLQDALSNELQVLKLDHLNLNLKPTGAKGETLHKMELVGCQYPQKVNLSEILSEGEQHVVAIAGFMAELQVTKNQSPIVFDDPVCSLDHLYREKIAQRLVIEAQSRQVLIFTHDISFLLELKAKAGEMEGTYFLPQTIIRIANSPGHCMDGLPWHSMPVKERTNYLQDQLNEFESLYKTDTLEYNRRAGHFYSLLRETWEAFIEEILFQGTIIRHSGEVQTLKLSYVSVIDKDYRIIHLSMKKCSKWMFGHDKSHTVDVNRPAPEDLQKDIDILKDLIKTIKRRREDVRKQRLSTLEPKSPSIG